MKNHSQLRDLTLSEEELFDRRIMRKIEDPIGLKTPLGHSYSLVLEALALEGIDAIPNPKEFLNFVIEYVDSRGYSFEAEIAKSTKLMSPTYYPSEARAVWNYMLEKGLSLENSSKVMKNILGQELYEFSPRVEFMSTSFTGSEV